MLLRDDLHECDDIAHVLCDKYDDDVTPAQLRFRTWFWFVLRLRSMMNVITMMSCRHIRSSSISITMFLLMTHEPK